MNASERAVEEIQDDREFPPASLIDPLLSNGDSRWTREATHCAGPCQCFLDDLIIWRAAFGKDVGGRDANVNDLAFAAKYTGCVRRGTEKKDKTSDR